MTISSFEMSFRHKRLVIRYEPTGEKRIRYGDIMPKLITPVKATEAQVDEAVKLREKAIVEATDLDDKQKKAALTRAKATTERKKIKQMVENDLAIKSAEAQATKIMADIEAQMRQFIEQIVSKYPTL